MSKAKSNEDSTAVPDAADAVKITGNEMPEGGGVSTPPRRLPSLSILLVLLAAFLPNLTTLDNGFLLEDQSLIASNPYLRGGAAVGALFGEAFWDACNEGRYNLYQPLTMVSFAVNHRLGGLDPFGCHLTNVMLHVVACLLLLLLLRRLLPRGMLALAATLLFALHPIHTEAVAAVLGRSQLLGAALVFAAWLVHMVAWPLNGRGSDGPGNHWRRQAGLSLLSVLLFLLALLSGGSAAGMLPVIILGDLLRLKRKATILIPDDPDEDDFFTPDKTARWQVLARLPWAVYAGLLAAVAVYLGLRQRILGSIVGDAAIPFLDNPLASVETPVRLMTAVKVIGEYLGLLILPLRLSADYAFNQIKLVTSAGDPGFLASLVACLALLVGAAVLSRSDKGRIPALGIAIFFCTIAPVSNIFFSLGDIMSERVLYLPALGFCLVLASLLCLAAREVCGTGARSGDGLPLRPSRTWMVALLVLLIIAAYAARTVTRNRQWLNQEVLLQDAAQVSPHSARVHGTLGTWHFERGEYVPAARALERAVAIHPDYPIALYMLGRTRIELGEMDGAREALTRVAELRPDHPEVLLALGAVEFRLDRLEEATSLFRQTLDLDPDNHYALESLGISLRQSGQYEEAIEVFQACLEHRPDEVSNHFNLAATLRAADRLEEAEAACRSALSLDEGHHGSLLTLADICRQTDREDEAAALRARALGVPPDTAD